MRKAVVAVAVAALTPLLVALPSASDPGGPKPRPVRASIQTLPLARAHVDAQARRRAPEPAAAVTERGLRRPSSRPTVLTAERDTRPFQLVGVTWDRASTQAPAMTVWVRTRTPAGWGGWHALVSDSHGPDAPSREARGARGGTEPVLVPESRAVQVRVDAPGDRLPAGLRVELVDPGKSPADATAGALPRGSAAAAPSRPTIYSRAQWGADESIRRCDPDVAPTVRMAFVHHTVSSNGYASWQTAGLIRSIYAYHVQARGWCDIGYNMIVDRFGRAWEGRAGSITQPVVGAHVANYNTMSFGVSALGTFTDTAPSSNMTSTLGKVLGWRLGQFFRDPQAATTLNGKRFSVVSGHRDGGQTACPGARLYAQLPEIRSLARAHQGAVVYNPYRRPSARDYATGGFEVRAGVPGAQFWTLTVSSPCRAEPVRVLTGRAFPWWGGLRARWDGRSSDGSWVPPGRYTLTLTGRDGRGPTPVYRTTVSVRATSAAPPSYCG